MIDSATTIINYSRMSVIEMKLMRLRTFVVLAFSVTAKMMMATETILFKYVLLNYCIPKVLDKHVSLLCESDYRKQLKHWGRVTHYLNQCWNSVNSDLRKKLQCHLLLTKIAFENVVCRMAAILLWFQWVDWTARNKMELQQTAEIQSLLN